MSLRTKNIYLEHIKPAHIPCFMYCKPMSAWCQPIHHPLYHTALSVHLSAAVLSFPFSLSISSLHSSFPLSCLLLCLSHSFSFFFSGTSYFLSICFSFPSSIFLNIFSLSSLANLFSLKRWLWVVHGRT